MEISKTKTSLLATLHTKKMRLRHGLFLAEGDKCVTDMLGAFRLENLIAKQSWLDRKGIPHGVEPDKLLTASDAAMAKISSLSTEPEVIAVFRMPDEDAGCPVLEKDKLYLLLDGIQDPGNLGTIIRTADWFGFYQIFASKDTVDVFNPKTVQSTMGSLQRVRVVYTDLASLIERNGIKDVYGTLLDGKNMFESNIGKSGVIIMGNEGNGISEGLRKYVNCPLLIPPYGDGGHGESLNVAVATAITLACFRNR